MNPGEKKTDFGMESLKSSQRIATSPPNHHQQYDIATVMRHVAEHVRLLYNASALLKRPGITGRYLRTNATTNIDDGDLKEFLSLNRGHIEEKLLQWYDDWAVQNQDNYRGRAESGAVSVQVHEVLISRLANANMKRRKQLRYWLRHADGSEDMPLTVAGDSRLQHQQKLATTTFGNLDIVNLSTDPIAPSVAARTTNTKVSFSTAVMSELKETHEEAVAHTEYEESVIGNFKSTQVPPVPTIAHKTPEFVCPYCGLRLKSSLMKNRRTWK